MRDPVHIDLLPLGKSLRVERGTRLQDALFSFGVEFPCGGRGRCQGCKIRLAKGDLPVSDDDARLLDAAQIGAGWRLACRATAQSDLKVEIGQWETAVLVDNSAFEFTPQEGLGVAVDLGTTTVVAQLVDLRTAQVVSVRAALNAQAKRGADIMSRVEYAVAKRGQPKLTYVIRSQIGKMIQEMVEGAKEFPANVTQVVVVGNTVMHHLFCGIDLEPLSHYPFEPVYYGLQIFRAEYLDWKIRGNPTIRFLPCLGGFVGSDILAGVLATRLHESSSLVALIDLGTNGEIVVGHSKRLLCASTAAGPAFEGARISHGMRAATGAISEVAAVNGQLQCRAIGGGSPRGICGSGLVDAIAAGLDLGWIESSGKLARGSSMLACPGIALTQGDIRELQLAKGAIAAGFRMLVERSGVRVKDVTRLYLAGAFGNYVNVINGRRIGLLCTEPERVQPSGNTALLGAKLALFGLNEHDGAYSDLLKKIEHVPLNEDPQFQEIYVDEMRFPETAFPVR
ncbi:MAG: DUF4445 domain-containing protein [Verrucomicrobia bacterium]|nr:DUF4445 domain-containing protein [Verrucomicrobiota bacterium]